MNKIVNVAGFQVKLAYLGAVATLIAIATPFAVGFQAWGRNDQRITTLEGNFDQHHEDYKKLSDKVGRIAESQAATKTAVENILKEQRDQREHFDKRLDRVLEVIRQR